MKTLAILLLFCLFSCKNDESIKVYSWKEYNEALVKHSREEILVIDTICEWEKKLAEKQIQKDSIVFYSYHYTPEVIEELKILLKPYNIFPKFHVSSCIVAPEGFTEHCYEKRMNEEIIKRFGENWIDSLERKALRNYVIKNPDKPYIENGIDMRTKFLSKK
jgi:predicted kinase